LTQSAGVPLVAYPITRRPRRNSFTRRGVIVVIAWPTAERSASGATTVTSPTRTSWSNSACSPGEVIPSSLVSRIRGARAPGPLSRRPEA